MSRNAVNRSRIKVSNKSVFHLQDKKADDNELSIGLIKSAKRTGQLTLSNRGLGTGEIVNVIDVTSRLYIFFACKSNLD